MITATHSAIIDCENEKVAPELLKVAEGVTRCFIFAERRITLSLSYGLDTRPAIQSNAGHRRHRGAMLCETRDWRCHRPEERGIRAIVLVVRRPQ